MRRHLRLALVAAACLAPLAACGHDVAAPEPAAPATRPSLLLTASEGMKILVDTVDASGNHVMVAEYAAGGYTLPDGTPALAGSVVIETVIPQLVVGSTSAPCITSTIVRVDTYPGWTATVKKPGGCDKEIQVEFANAAGQRARFSFLMIFGKTKIDHGTVS